MYTGQTGTWGGLKITRLFQYLKMQMKYKFFLKFKFPEICYFMQNFIELSLVTTEIS